jgi:hypothetical protein
MIGKRVRAARFVRFPAEINIFQFLYTTNSKFFGSG